MIDQVVTDAPEESRENFLNNEFDFDYGKLTFQIETYQ